MVNVVNEQHSDERLRQALILTFRPVVQEEIRFRDISYIERWQPFCSVEWNRL